MKKYLIKVKFRRDEDPVYLTEAGQPFELAQEELAEQVKYLKDGEGFLGDLFDAYGDGWDLEAVWVVELGLEHLQ